MTRRLAALATIAVAFLSGCSPAEPDASSTPSATAPVETPSQTPSSTPTPTPTPTPSTDESAPSTANFIPKDIGETGGMTAPDTGDVLMEFTLTEVVYDYTCAYDASSVNGHFVGLNFDVAVHEGWPTYYPDFPGVSIYYPQVQSYVGDVRVNDPIGNGAGCASSADALPTDIAPGTSASGWIVLDLPNDATSVAWVPVFADGQGWEWQLDG